MARRRGHTEEQILAALWQAESGTTAVEVCRQVGITDADVLYMETEVCRAA